MDLMRERERGARMEGRSKGGLMRQSACARVVQGASKVCFLEGEVQKEGRKEE